MPIRSFCTRLRARVWRGSAPSDTKTDVLSRAVPETFDASSCELFLEQLVRHRRKGRKMLVVVDNARWHHSRQLQPWLHEHRHVMRLDFLPSYSPELNPVERVWKLTRYQCTHSRYFPVLDDLVTAVWNHFSLWTRPNETLRRLCAII